MTAEGTSMENIIVGRYEDTSHGYQGWIEPESMSWIIFISNTGQPVLFPHRDSSGAVIETK